MTQKKLLTEKDLAALAKRFRKQAGKTRAEAASRNGCVARFHSSREENPEISLLKLRMRMIEEFSPFKVVGPVFHLRRR